jgi:hypothetical protein
VDISGIRNTLACLGRRPRHQRTGSADTITNREYSVTNMPTLPGELLNQAIAKLLNHLELQLSIQELPDEDSEHAAIGRAATG